MTRKRNPKQKRKRNLTLLESENILRPLVEKEPFVKFGDHTEYSARDFGENVFRLIVNVISLDTLISIMEHKQVHNVYFTPTAPPPDFSVDGITMAYKLYIKYHQLHDEK